MKDYNHYTYEITWITNTDELNNNAALVESFFKLYEDPSNFPDPDEREEPLFIKERISHGTNNPHTHLMAYLLISPTGEKTFLGGCIVEFYPDSACGLVTYLFVDQAYRGIKIGSEQMKIAESLIKSEIGLPGLILHFSSLYKKKINAVFFESNNPYDTLPEDDSMPPVKRLKFFHRQGGKRVNFSYIQPPLGDDKGIVTNLYLLAFPWITGLSDAVPVKTVISFVMELAKSLDQNKEPDSKTSYGTENYLHDRQVISEAGQNNAAETWQKLRGLEVNGQNIIKDMYKDLLTQSTDSHMIELTTIPGIDV